VTGAPPGGLRVLFTMVLGGMVGESPHMVAAAVMALARLLYEFGGALAASVPELMPAALSLLRSRAREVVKAVLGFLKVRLCPATAGSADFTDSWFCLD
jgi:ribosomal RNA-processing protein 12